MAVMTTGREKREVPRGQVVRESKILVITEDYVFRTTPRHSACSACRHRPRPWTRWLALDEFLGQCRRLLEDRLTTVFGVLDALDDQALLGVRQRREGFAPAFVVDGRVHGVCDRAGGTHRVRDVRRERESVHRRLRTVHGYEELHTMAPTWSVKKRGRIPDEWERRRPRGAAGPRRQTGCDRRLTSADGELAVWHFHFHSAWHGFIPLRTHSRDRGRPALSVTRSIRSITCVVFSHSHVPSDKSRRSRFLPSLFGSHPPDQRPHRVRAR
jgi:hypothetical protein